MKHQYIVSGNAFNVTVEGRISAWEELRPRYDVFAAEATGSAAQEATSTTAADTAVANPVLEAAVRVAPIPAADGEVIYRPEHNEVSLVTACASRTADGSLVMEFHDNGKTETRLWMRMPADMTRAEIVVKPDGDDNDSYVLTHALMIAYLLATASNGTLLIHSSAVIYQGRAYLFQGKSGTGKSTHARLWTDNILGASLLNDDHPVVRIADDGTAMAYGSPWSGKTHCYRDESAPIGAFVRIVRAEENELRRIVNPLKAYASLTASMFRLPFFDERQRSARHLAIERLVAAVPCAEMLCRPDADAAWRSMRALRASSAVKS